MPTHAAEIGDPEPTQEYASQWGVGAGVGIKRSPYRGIGNETNAIPLLSFQNRYVRFFGTTLDAKLPSAGPIDFSVRARYGLGDGYKSSDASYLSGMEERKGGLSLGLATTWHTDLANVSLEWMRATSNGKGNRIKLAVERSFDVSNSITVTPYAGIERADRKDVDYYFGVTNSEIRANRPGYEGRATTNVEGGIRLDYAFTKQQNLFFDVGVQHWGAGVTDSPLVDRSTSPSLRIGYLYRF
ncbi:MipA/OmpV family protein [Schauerella aestuarii]|uniref:MipA/OmpV family protein n=1 Tax=Schauerella aestuarii TaxID=2511204 RepID=UPI001F3C26AA|nr:MipA/OmpV family protein [Achromobacter aestuarii]